MAEATITSKGQITIPAEVRKDLGLDAGDRIVFVRSKQGEYSFIPATHSIRELKGLFARKLKRPVTIEEMNAAIRRRAAKLR